MNGDGSHERAMGLEIFRSMIYEWERPSLVRSPRIFLDGNRWCCLLGSNIQEGICGFGRSPELACQEFDKAWQEEKKA